MERRHDLSQSFQCNLCEKTCLTRPGLARHKGFKHPDITAPERLSSHTRIFHRTLNGMPAFLTFYFCSDVTTASPCHEDGTFLQESPGRQMQSEIDQHIHDWTPFEDRLAFDWAYYHYVVVQSSASSIAQGLNLWSATTIKYGSSAGAPWSTAKDMYATIDTIQTGSLPFQTYIFHYAGPKPSTPPHWMEQTYELNTRDVLAVIREQLATPTFKDQFDCVPYQEFNSEGERIWSNLMSGHWAFNQAVCQLPVSFWPTCLLRCPGRALTRPKQSWGDVCPHRCWERQDNCFSCYGSSRISSCLCFSRKSDKYSPASTREWCPSGRLLANTKGYVIFSCFYFG